MLELFMPSNINTAKKHKVTKLVVMSNFVGKSLLHCSYVSVLSIDNLRWFS